MKVSYIVDNHSPAYGGPYTVISEQLNYLYKNNIDIELIYTSNSFTVLKRDYKKIIKNTDLVHIFGIWRPFHIRAFYASKKLNKKIIISPLGALEPWSLSQRRLKKKVAWNFYQKKILNNVDYVHATSEMEKKNLINIGVNSPIKVIPHGLEIYQNKFQNQKKLKKKAVFFSRIHEKKGLFELVQAWIKIDPENWELDIFGPISDTKYFSKIMKEIHSTSYNSKISINSPVYYKENKLKILSNSNLFVLPSKSENFGMSILEALSLGIPVLTTKSTPWEVLNSLNAGFIIDFSEQNILNALKSIMKMKDDDLNTIGDNGKEFIKKNYNIKNLIKDYIAFYNWVHK